MMTTDNPFFESRWSGPYATPPFSRIATEHFEPAIRKQIDIALERVDRIARNPEPPTFDNTVVALTQASRELDRTLGVFYPLTSAQCSDELQEVEERMAPVLSRYSSTVSLNRELWDRIRTVAAETDPDTLSAEEKTLLDNTVAGYRRSGALLEGEDRERYRHLREQLSELTTTFGRNVLQATAGCRVTAGADQISGIDPSLLGDPDDTGNYTVTLSQPVYMELMRTADSRELRKAAYMAWSTRCTDGPYDNREILCRIAALRSELARLLGYETWAHYVMERNMARNPEAVDRLVEQLREAYRPMADAELKELAGIAGLERLEPWDYSYWQDKLRHHKYDASEESLRPYFALEPTLDAVLGLARTLYGVKLERRDDIETYHPDIRVYQAVNQDTGGVIGLLYVDLWSRPDKSPGAWMTEFRGQSEGVLPLISIVTNFRQPAGAEQAQLSPREVTTLLHEFGHALHGLLSQARFEELGGTNVRRDFVELPSQLNENFFRQPEWLTFARHCSTGEPLPADAIERLEQAERCGAGYAGLRQLGFVLLDLAWHRLGVNDSVSPEQSAEFERRAMDSVATFEPVEGTMTSPTFGHIFSGGYSAGYYSYKWAEVLAADAFGLFADEGAMTERGEAATAFRREILSRGGTEAPELLYKRFRRREPSIDALLKQERGY